MGYYSALKKVEILSQAITFEDIMLNEISQSQKDNYCVNPLTGGTQSTQVSRDRKQNGGCQGLEREGDGELFFKVFRVSIWEDEKVLETDCVDGYTIMCM